MSNKATVLSLTLASFVLFPLTAGAVKPNSTDAKGEPNAAARKVIIGLNDLQDITGCDFTPANGGMQITQIRKQDGVFPKNGLEVGDTILSIDRATTTDLQSLINAVKNAKGRMVVVIAIDHRGSGIYDINMAF